MEIVTLDEPLTPTACRSLLLQIVESGRVEFSPHALPKMQKHKVTEGQAIQVLRGGLVEPAEFENGSWRYRVRASKTYAVVSFRSETWTVVVTAWRVKR